MPFRNRKYKIEVIKILTRDNSGLCISEQFLTQSPAERFYRNGKPPIEKFSGARCDMVGKICRIRDVLSDSFERIPATEQPSLNLITAGEARVGANGDGISCLFQDSGSRSNYPLIDLRLMVNE